MGYDLHITRRSDWADTGNDISAEEWLNYIRGDPELTLASRNGAYHAVWDGPPEDAEPWLDWSQGQIYSKNPDAPLINKMISIAEKLKATVQGDDGEIYDERSQPQDDGRAPRQPALSLRQRVTALFTRWLPSRRSLITHEPLPFNVGDRVRDTWGHEHIVTAIDPTAEHGMGVIRTRRSDGTKLGHMMIAHGLVPVVQKEKVK